MKAGHHLFSIDLIRSGSEEGCLNWISPRYVVLDTRSLRRQLSLYLCRFWCDFMKSNVLLKLCCVISVAVLVASATTFHADGAERPASAKATAPTNQMTLDAVVADILEHNPEVNFYSAEIAAAKGGARTAATLNVRGSCTTVVSFIVGR